MNKQELKLKRLDILQQIDAQELKRIGMSNWLWKP